MIDSECVYVSVCGVSESGSVSCECKQDWDWRPRGGGVESTTSARLVGLLTATSLYRHRHRANDDDDCSSDKVCLGAGVGLT